jgi:Tol biopolymer transport system component
MTKSLMLAFVLAPITAIVYSGRTGQPASIQDGPELFEPGNISTHAGEIFPAFSPDGETLYFNTHESGWTNHTLVMSHRDGDGWSAPEVLTFSGRFNDRAPRPSPDGRRLYFSSDRPLEDGKSPGDFNLWVVERAADGSWGEPRALPEPVNTPNDEWHSSVTADGTLYFSSRDRPAGHGRSDIYRTSSDGSKYSQPENLGQPINDELSQPDLYVSPEGRFMILVITDHPAGYGGDDLYVSYFNDGSWTPPENLGPLVNSPEYEYGPTISPGGRYLYFSSHRRGEGDIYRIEIDRLPVDLGR